MILADKFQKQYIYKLCRFDKEAKEAAVLAITNGRTDSTTQLTHAEANQLIVNLGGKPISYNNWAWFDKNNSKHTYILSLCIQYGWIAQGTNGNIIANIGMLSEWLKHRSPVKKHLKKMTPEELSKVIKALEQMGIKKYK